MFENFILHVVSLYLNEAPLYATLVCKADVAGKESIWQMCFNSVVLLSSKVSGDAG